MVQKSGITKQHLRRPRSWGANLLLQRRHAAPSPTCDHNPGASRAHYLGDFPLDLPVYEAFESRRNPTSNVYEGAAIVGVSSRCAACAAFRARRQRAPPDDERNRCGIGAMGFVGETKKKRTAYNLDFSSKFLPYDFVSQTL